MPRKKKKYQSQQEQQIPRSRQNDGGGGEELSHEVKHEGAVSIVKSAVQPAIEYKYGPDDINLLTQALDGVNRAMHYLSKKELVHHSHIIELIQALQDTSNSLHKIIPVRIDEELKRNIAWEQRKGSRHTYYIADRLVAAHAGSIRSLLSSMKYELGYLHEWCGEFRELAIHRIICGRFKEIESTVPIEKQAKAKTECVSALTSVPKIVDGEIFDLPLHDPQSCFDDQFGSPLANIWEALTIIKHISPNVPQQPLTQSKMGAIASAIMVTVENLKKLPRDHVLRNDGSTFLALKELRNEFAHSTEIKGFTRRPDNLFLQYIEPFLMFRDHVVEPIINNMPRTVSASRDRTIEESVQEEDGAVLQDVDASYRKAHRELFDKLLQIGYIIKSGVNPVYQANGRIFSDEELVKIFIRLIILDKELLVQILEESRRYTTLSRKSLLNMPILYRHYGSQHKDGKIVFQYGDEENKYLTRLTLDEPMLMHANINCPSYRNVYVLELVVKQAQWALGANNNVGVSFVRTLLEFGANPNVEIFFPCFDDVIHPLIVCASAVHNRGGLLKLLLEHGANANLKNAKLFLRFASSGSSSKETDDFIRLLLKYGVDPLNEFETNADCTYNIMGKLASDDNISDEKACDTLLAIIRAIIPLYGMTAVQALLKSPFTDSRWDYNEKYLFVDILNRGIFYNKDGFKKLVNLLMELSSQDNELVHAVVSNDLKTIRRFFTVNHGSAVQALMNMRLYSIKSTKELRGGHIKLNKKQQDKLVEAESSKLNKQLKQGFKQELILINYHKHHKGPFNMAEQLGVVVVQHEIEEVGFNDVVKLFCDANVAEQVIAWINHGVDKVEASIPVLELKNDDDDGAEASAVVTKVAPMAASLRMRQTQTEAAATLENSMKVFYDGVILAAAAEAAALKGATIDKDVKVLFVDGKYENPGTKMMILGYQQLSYLFGFKYIKSESSFDSCLRRDRSNNQALSLGMKLMGSYSIIENPTQYMALHKICQNMGIGVVARKKMPENSVLEYRGQWRGIEDKDDSIYSTFVKDETVPEGSICITSRRYGDLTRFICYMPREQPQFTNRKVKLANLRFVDMLDEVGVGHAFLITNTIIKPGDDLGFDYTQSADDASQYFVKKGMVPVYCDAETGEFFTEMGPIIASPGQDIRPALELKDGGGKAEEAASLKSKVTPTPAPTTSLAPTPAPTSAIVPTFYPTSSGASVLVQNNERKVTGLEARRIVETVEGQSIMQANLLSDESALVRCQEDSANEDELPNSESVPAPYASTMSILDNAHQTVRIAGSVVDTIRMIKDPNLNTITRATTGYGHIAESTLGKNLGMKYLAPIGIASQWHQEDYKGAIKSYVMWVGRLLPGALMPVAPVPAITLKGFFVCYDTYEVIQDLRDLLWSQTEVVGELDDLYHG